MALEYKIDLSFLDAMDVDNNNKTKDKINMKTGGKFEFPLLMHKINVLPIKLSCFISLNPIFMFI